MLRQISNGLAVYRLYPGDLKQVSFQAAVERIRDAADKVLTGGTVAVEIHGTLFRLEEGEMKQDEALGRLAKACYERRLELLRVRAVPDASELGALYEILTTPLEEMGTSAEVAEQLAQHAQSIALGDIKPRAADPSQITDKMSEEEVEIWERLQHRGILTESSDGGSIDEQAQELFERMRGLLGALPTHLESDPDLFSKLHTAVDNLAPTVRVALATKLLDRMETEDVAERLVNTMSDAQLARTLKDVGEAGQQDALALARRMVESGQRHAELVDLTEALMAGHQDAGTIVTDLEEATSFRVNQDTALETASDIMGSDLLSEEEEDSRQIRAEYPKTETDMMVDSLATLEDYLAVEFDVDRLEKVLEVWTEHVRDALKRRDEEWAKRLMLMVERSSKRAVTITPGAEGVFKAYRRRVLDSSLAGELVTPGNQDDMRALLSPLGGAAVETLLDVLAEEDNRSRRATLISLLSDLAGDHHALLAERMADPRWYVVRNLVIILRQSAAGAVIVPLLRQAARHPHPQVRKEVVRAFVSAAGQDSVQYLRPMSNDVDEGVRSQVLSALGSLKTPSAAAELTRIVKTSKDLDLRKRALDELGRAPSAAGITVLQGLASWGSKPRLPRPLRKQARALVKRAKGSG